MRKSYLKYSIKFLNGNYNNIDYLSLYEATHRLKDIALDSEAAIGDKTVIVANNSRPIAFYCKYYKTIGVMKNADDSERYILKSWFK